MRNSIRIFAFLAVAMATAVPALSAPIYGTYNDNSALKARLEMRRLWSDHASLTHAYIVSTSADLPDVTTLAQRVQKNADDIANTLSQYYSASAGARLSTLLRAHAMLLSDAIQMARKNEKDEMTSVQDKLETNGRETVAFLCSLNPNWDEATLRGEFEEHVNHENDELTTRTGQDWAGGITAWDDAQAQVLRLADMLSLGIERQFPERFASAN